MRSVWFVHLPRLHESILAIPDRHTRVVDSPGYGICSIEAFPLFSESFTLPDHLRAITISQIVVVVANKYLRIHILIRLLWASPQVLARIWQLPFGVSNSKRAGTGQYCRVNGLFESCGGCRQGF